MKKLFTLLALIIIVKVNAQINVYKPFPEDQGTWIVQETGGFCQFCQPTYSWKKYEVIGDTTIGNYIYNKVYKANNLIIGQIMPFGPNSFAFGYRNDVTNKRVYYLDVTNNINKDTLWFDFNLNIGSYLTKSYAYDNGFSSNDPRGHVTSIDSVFSCGTYHKRFNFDCPMFETSLIEGVGFVDKFDKTYFQGGCPFEPSIIYSTTYSVCVSASINENSFSKNIISISPNPTTKNINIKVDDAEIIESIITDINGKQILISKSETNIDVSKLIAGIYFIKFKTSKGEFNQKFIKE